MQTRRQTVSLELEERGLRHSNKTKRSKINKCIKLIITHNLQPASVMVRREWVKDI